MTKAVVTDVCVLLSFFFKMQSKSAHRPADPHASNLFIFSFVVLTDDIAYGLTGCVGALL